MTTPLNAKCVDELLTAADEIGLPAGRVEFAAADLREALVRPIDPKMAERHLRVLDREVWRLQQARRTPHHSPPTVARTVPRARGRVRTKGLAVAAILGCGLVGSGGLAAAGVIGGTPRAIVESVADQIGLGFDTPSGNDSTDNPGAVVTEPADPHTVSTPSPPVNAPSPSSPEPAVAAEPGTNVSHGGGVDPSTENPSTENPSTENPGSEHSNRDNAPGHADRDTGSGDVKPGNGNLDPGNPNAENPGDGKPTPKDPKP